MGSSTERERDRYIDWLRARGASDEDMEAHRVYAERILYCVDAGPVQPADVDAAVERERADGAPESRVANLRRVGEYLMQFQREWPAGFAPAPDPVTADFAPPEPEMDTADIELATPVPRTGRVSATRLPAVAVAPRRTSSAHRAGGTTRGGATRSRVVVSVLVLVLVSALVIVLIARR